MKRSAMILVVLFSLSRGLVSPAADFNGDETDDISIFRPNVGLWAVRGVTRAYFGGTGDNPAPGDYNGDGTDEIAVNRPGTGLWAVRGVTRAYFGNSADISLGGDGGRWLPSGSGIYYNSGTVGIGTTASASDLDVWDTGDAGNAATLALHGSGVNSNSLVEFWESGAIAMSIYYNGSANKLYLYDETQDAYRVTFQRTGNVGIGTTSPGAKLHVYGDTSQPGLVVRGGSSTPPLDYDLGLGRREIGETRFTITDLRRE
ncbi:MAG: hypothetical protein V1789_03215 [PVC group bacterium]